MDATDFRLLVALHEDARASYRSLGRRVSLSAPAVRDRLRHLESKGVIDGFWLTPDPEVIGRQDLIVIFQGEYAHADAVTALGAPEVAWVALKVDGGLTIQMWPLDREGSLRRLIRLLGREPTGQTLADPTPHAPLGRIDWRIMETLVDDPRLSLGEVCDRTGLSPKTVRKHIHSMLREQAVYITPKLGSFGDVGEIIFPLLVYGKVRVSEVRRTMGDAFLINSGDVPPTKYFLCRAPDMGEVTSRVRAVQRLPGVESAIVTINRELLVNTPFIRSVIREQMTVPKRLSSS